MNYCTETIKLDDNIAKSKNKTLKCMLKTDKDYFFLIEDNCEVLDEKVFDKFIQTSEKTGIEVLSWQHGGPNRRIEFDDDPYIDYYSDFTTAFTMYTRNAIVAVGLLDEKMPPNTWQELEHTKRIGDIGLSTPFGQFACPKNVKGLKLTRTKDEFKNLKQMQEALDYWASDGDSDFPIQIKDKKQIASQPVTQMI